MADTTLRVIIAGDSSGLVRAMDESAAAADAASTGINNKFGALGDKAGGIFQKIGNAIQNATGGIIPAGDAMEKFREKLSAAGGDGDKFSTTMSTLGGATLVGLAAGLAGTAGEAVHLGVEMQETTSKIAASAGISQAAAKKIGDAFLSTAGSTTFSGQEMAAAYAKVAGQLGETEGHALSAKQALDVMRASSDLAEASGTDLGSTTQSLAAVLQTFGLKATDAGHASDVLYNAAKAVGLPVADVANGVDKLKGRLGILAPSLGDTATLMTALGEHGIAGTRGIMVVNTAFQTLLGGSKTVNAEIQKLGVRLYDQQGHFVGMNAVISQLNPVLSKMTDAQRVLAEKTLFGASAGQAMNGVLMGGFQAYMKVNEAVTASGTAHEAAEKSTSNLKGSVEKLKAAGEDLATKFGEVLIPKLTELGQVVAGVINWFEKHKAAATALAAVIATVLGGAVVTFAIGKVQQFVGGIQKMVSALENFALRQTVVAETVETTDEAMGAASDSMFGVWGIAIAAVIMVITLLATHWKEVWGVIKTVALDVWNAALKPVFDALKSAAKDVAGVFATAWHAIDSVIQFVGDHIVTIIKIILAVALGPLGIAIDLLWTHWHTVWDAIKTAMDTVWGALKPIFDAIVDFFKVQIDAALTALSDTFHAVWGAIQTVVSAVWGVLKPIFDTAENIFSAVIVGSLNTLKSTFDTVWHGIQDVITTVWNVVKPIIDTMKSAIDAVSGAVKGIAGVAGSVGHGISSALHVIGLASGGYVDKPTLAVVGEAGPEMVIPMSQLGGISTDRSAVRPLPTGGPSTGGGTGGGINPTYVINVTAPTGNGDDIKRALQSAMDEHDRQLYRTLSQLGVA